MSKHIIVSDGAYTRLKGKAKIGQSLGGVIEEMLNELEPIRITSKDFDAATRCSRCGQRRHKDKLKDGICGNCADDLRDKAAQQECETNLPEDGTITLSEALRQSMFKKNTGHVDKACKYIDPEAYNASKPSTDSSG